MCKHCRRRIVPLSREAASKRRVTAERRFPHDDESGALQVAHDALGSDGGYVLGSVVFSLATLKPEREGNRLGEVSRVGGRELVVVASSTVARP